MLGVLVPRCNYGSSPREWGTLDHPAPFGDHVRFIPTRVGNTTSEAERRVIFSVHPHASGEHLHLQHV